MQSKCENWASWGYHYNPIFMVHWGGKKYLSLNSYTDSCCSLLAINNAVLIVYKNNFVEQWCQPIYLIDFGKMNKNEMNKVFTYVMCSIKSRELYKTIFTLHRRSFYFITWFLLVLILNLMIKLASSFGQRFKLNHSIEIFYWTIFMCIIYR